MPIRPATLAAVACLVAPAPAQFVVADDLLRIGIDDAEITPDGRFAVAREGSQASAMLVYDLVQGGAPVRHPANFTQLGGAAQDAVAVTDERAVMLGNQLLIADLTQAGAPVLARHDVGYFARDLVITPDETLLVVRGGQTVPGNPGGQFVFDLASGAQLASHPGEPGDYFQNQYPFDVDSVVANDRWAVVTSFIDNSPAGFATRVSVWDLRPLTSLTPLVVFETDALTDLDGAPHDVALAPGGAFAAVRSEFEVGYVDLSGPAPTLGWTRPLFNMPGPLGLSVMDSIEVTDARIATLSRWSNGGVGAQIDVFDTLGGQYFELLDGDPHDLAITPSGERLVARTSSRVLLYDLVNLPTTGNGITALDVKTLNSSHTSFGAGLDSVVCTDERAVACARFGEITRVRVYDLRHDRLDVALVRSMPARPIDLDLSPDGTEAWISGFTHVLGIDLRANAVTFEHDPTAGGGYPWCDGVAVGAEHVVAFGYTMDPSPMAPLPPLSGWVSIIDRFVTPAPFCPSTPNSTGRAAELFATGSASAARNDLVLWTSGATPGAFGFFYYGDQAPAPVAYGDGFTCVGGQTAGFPAVRVAGDGVARQDVDNTALPAGGGALLPGTTWYFQFVLRDLSVLGARWNLSQGLAITFES